MSLKHLSKGEMEVIKSCTHKEVDSRIMLQALDGSFSGHGKIMIRSNDTDVVILAIPIAKVLP